MKDFDYRILYASSVRCNKIESSGRACDKDCEHNKTTENNLFCFIARLRLHRVSAGSSSGHELFRLGVLRASCHCHMFVYN